MGCCVSKKEVGSSTVSAIPTSHSSSSFIETHKLETQIQVQKKKVQQQEVEEIKQVQEVKKTEAGGEDAIVKNEVFVIEHSKSHDNERPKEIEDEVCNVSKVRTSSCSKEEVDAILIQCGRLSRSNSSGKANSSGGKKYSGSKRSYDFDVEEVKGSDEGDGEDKRQHRQRERRHNRPSSSSPSGRRRTPSRERDPNQLQQQQRSGSRERSGGSGGNSSRRVSRSPGRRSDTNNANSNANGAMGTANRPGKMVSVPPTVSSSSLERNNNGGESAAIKRISVKRNVGGEAAVTRGVASPRSQSPARANAKENQQQPPSLSRSSSRKAEQSPYKRNPLSEIDPNSLSYPQSSIDKAPGSNNHKCKEIEAEVVLNQKQNLEINNDRVVGQGKSHKKGNKGTQNMKDVSAECLVKEQKQIVEEAKRQTTTTTVIPAGAESQKPQTVTRSRSSRRSRDLDINPEALLNAEPSYTRLLLEDIQNFHQKNTNTNTPSFSLPACISKACSILEAVADLNSTTSSNVSCALSDDRRGLPTDQSNSNKAGYTFVGKKAPEAKDPYIESEVVVNDDLMEPSFHKYVTVRRGGTLGEEEDMDEQESSGSNSFSGTGAQQNWGMSSSSWEPSSGDSASCWTSRFNGREEDHSNAPGFQRQGFSESGRAMDEARRGVSGKRNRGIGRNMVVSGDGFLATPAVAATASM